MENLFETVLVHILSQNYYVMELETHISNLALKSPSFIVLLNQNLNLISLQQYRYAYHVNLTFSL